MDVLVVGAGVIGLAVGRALAMRGHEVIVADKADGIGSGVSSRNSEVIHAGMYYPSGSMRARHCVAGNRELYAFCESHGVPHRRCGKLIVATSDAQVPAIEKIYRQGLANDVEGLRLVDGAEARTLEPAVACHAALVSDRTGIIDSHAYMLALQGDLEAHGGFVALRTPVDGLARRDGRWVACLGGADAAEHAVDAVVNCAALGAQALAQATDGYPAERVPRRVLAKGNYFGYARRSPFSRLIYPAPVEGGLGIHVTMDLAGRLRFGPDVEWVETEDYEVDPGRASRFGDAIRRYWPDVRDEDLTPDYAGIRPKLSGPGEPARDFLIDGPAEHGLPGLVHLFGVESPGLTSSLSLAEDVADRIHG
jgi:L-2-hydroxyglutarate oxidase LhgO